MWLIRVTAVNKVVSPELFVSFNFLVLDLVNVLVGDNKIKT